jgi:hypothetical protein
MQEKQVVCIGHLPTEISTKVLSSLMSQHLQLAKSVSHMFLAGKQMFQS